MGSKRKKWLIFITFYVTYYIKTTFITTPQTYFWCTLTTRYYLFFARQIIARLWSGINLALGTLGIKYSWKGRPWQGVLISHCRKCRIETIIISLNLMPPKHYRVFLPPKRAWVSLLQLFEIYFWNTPTAFSYLVLEYSET